MYKVSCIMPTTSLRIKFIPLAISYFLRQDYKDSELIVLSDDVNSKIKDLIQDIPNIRYLQYSTKGSTIGSKRNYACSLSQGDIILHWDDDDWYAPDWIQQQVDILEKNNAAICGLNCVNFFNPLTKESWRYVYSYNNLPWVAGATLTYRKAHWERNPFRDINVGEDNEFVWHSGGKVIVQPYTDGFVSILHKNNTSPKHTSDKQWQPQSILEIKRILGDDFFEYITD